MATRSYEGKKFDLQKVETVSDALTVEEALQIVINEKSFTLSMRTPGADLELVRGMLHSEDIINSSGFHPVVQLDFEKQDGIVAVAALKIPDTYLGEGYANSRSLLSVSSCGICGKTELGEQDFGSAIASELSFSAERFSEMFEQMNQHQHDFMQSGGTHAAALFDRKGGLIVAREDIGRHNAVDKAVGQLLLEGRLDEAKVMTVSGRISYEITIKAFRAGIPFLAAVSAPSSLAVDYAKEFGITLLGFCRDGRATCYSNPQRVNNIRIHTTNHKAP